MKEKSKIRLSEYAFYESFWIESYFWDIALHGFTRGCHSGLSEIDHDEIPKIKTVTDYVLKRYEQILKKIELNELVEDISIEASLEILFGMEYNDSLRDLKFALEENKI